MNPDAPTSSTRRRKSADAETGRTGRLTPESWIDAATEVLVDEGIDHVRVDVLATQLGVTRGSFYWHFKDREELLRAVLKAWHVRATANLTARLESAHPDPLVQLREVLTLPFRGRAARKAARIELAIRAWSRRDQLARYSVDEADASRIGYIAQLFSALGFSISEARSRAALCYALVVAESLVPSLDQPTQRAARNEFVQRLLTQPLT
jgi:AcrR family transcriptional regulator